MVSPHVPLGVTIACLVMTFGFGFPTLCFSLGHGYEAKAELRIQTWQHVYNNYTVHSRMDGREYGQIQPTFKSTDK